jgi:hypothetical protein
VRKEWRKTASGRFTEMRAGKREEGKENELHNIERVKRQFAPRRCRVLPLIYHRLNLNAQLISQCCVINQFHIVLSHFFLLFAFVKRRKFLFQLDEQKKIIHRKKGSKFDFTAKVFTLSSRAFYLKVDTPKGLNEMILKSLISPSHRALH